MEDLTDVFLTPLPESPYVKPLRFNYTQNGKRKTWDLLHVHDSVAIIVFNVSRKVLVFVKQFRPAVYYNCISDEDRENSVIDTEKYPASLGICLEMCAGIIDKKLSIEDIAREEVLEECGYNVDVSQLQRVMSYRSGVGVQGALQTLFYCEVTDDMKVEEGGGVDEELIEIVEMNINEVEEYVSSPGPLTSPPSCLFAVMWFLHHKANKFRKSYKLTCGECKMVKI
ncbi:uridine diphosphate glucose pyrophosphatase NUDT14 [Amyelois transitella]|uniref:uridine diphosphate glucose pyrophosphatase NUDT14 n=1 Tax=Amyelois transitella TaxID=680683 RepID=UPI00067AA7A6|nr:uridine diphosphate glucose pyrophosphatase NUDT14 [Amyelois transitella]XP_013193720.1 uridine diphosphate glucose pyrophosphatase NUDT14 [Amyelois transitella]